MSILIKNMGIPKSCWDCPFHDEDVCYPGKMSIRRNHHSDRSEHCPLIEVPKHGRLIDADMLKRSITANLPIAVQDICPSFCNIVDMQKTVIDESGEE